MLWQKYFDDPACDHSEGLVSSFSSLLYAIIFSPIESYCYRLKSTVMNDKKKEMLQDSSWIVVNLHQEEKTMIFSHTLCSPDQSKLDSYCRGDECIVCWIGMRLTKSCPMTSLKQWSITSLPEINVMVMLINSLVKKSTWCKCRNVSLVKQNMIF